MDRGEFGGGQPAEFRIPVSPLAGVLLFLLAGGLTVLNFVEESQAPPLPRSLPSAPAKALPPTATEATVDSILAALKVLAEDGRRRRHLTLQVDPAQASRDEVMRMMEQEVLRADNALEEAMAPGRLGVTKALTRLPDAQVGTLVARMDWLPSEERQEILLALGSCPESRIVVFCRSLRSVNSWSLDEARLLSLACVRAPSLSVDLLEALPWREDDATRQNVLSSLQFHDDLEGAIRLFANMESEMTLALDAADVLCMIGARTPPDRHRALVAASRCPPALSRRYMEELASGWERRDLLLAVLRAHRSMSQAGSSR